MKPNFPIVRNIDIKSSCRLRDSSAAHSYRDTLYLGGAYPLRILVIFLSVVVVRFHAVPQVKINTGTTVVAIADSSRIVLASDGRATDEVTGKTSTTCKMFVSNRIAFALVGKAEINGFVVSDFAKRACQRTRTLLDAVGLFEITAKRKLLTIAEDWRKNLPKEFDKVNDSLLFNVIFAKFEGNVPLIYTTGIKWRAAPDRLTWTCIVNEKVEANRNLGRPIICPWGFRNNIVNFVNTHPHFLDTTDAIKAAIEFVRMEIQEDSVHVNEPIDVLEITPDTILWRCPDKKKCGHPE